MKKKLSIKKIFFATIITSILTSSVNFTFAEAQHKNTSNYNETKKFKNIKIQAEEGKASGNVIFETVNNSKYARYIGNGEENSLTLTINSPSSLKTKMILTYVSGEDRNLSYKVNNGEEKTIKGLNSGSWNLSKNSQPIDINLLPGENKIKFYLKDGYAPDIDYLTFSNDNEIKQDIKVKFVANNQEIGNTFIQQTNGTIQLNKVPKNPTMSGKDFLGWFWGPNLKYEANFPLDLSKIPQNIIDNLNGEIIFTAKFGNNQPANPVEKEGYRLIFQEEFNNNNSELDKTKFVDKYLSSWSTQAQNTSQYKINDGIVNIQINETTKPWCPEFDGQTVVTGFTTGDRNGLHNWNGNNIVRNPSDSELTHINQYGYYEVRAKAQSGSSRHSAWWLLGFEDIPEESAEIDIFEVLGRNNNQVPPAVHKWNDKDAFNKKPTAYTNNNKDFNNEWHIYGFDWQQGTGEGAYPDKCIFYIDGEKYAEINVNIDYPMIQLFSLYEKRAGGWTGDWEWMPYPNSFEIDYIRVYKKLPEGKKAISNDKLKVVDIKAENLFLKQDEILLKTYSGTNYTEKHLSGTKSYVRVNWNDGIETQEPVIWEEITKQDLKTLREGNSITKKGKVPSINMETEMTINIIK